MASFQFTNPDKLDFSKPENWEKWFQRFDRFRQASGLCDKDETIQISTLIYSMGSEADDIFTSFSLTEANRKKWKHVVDKFNEYFIPKRNIIFERSKFNLRKQEEGETVDSFVTDLHVLADHCNFGALHNEMIRDRIVVGVRDHKVSEKMQLDAKLTLEKAVVYARQSEAVRRQQALVRGTENFSQETTEDAVNRVKLKTVKTKPKKHQNYPKQQNCPVKRTNGGKRCGSFKTHGRDKCPARDAKCFKCEKTGHFAKCCLTKSTLGNINSRNENRDFLGAVNKGNSHPWITNIKIKNVDIPFKIDTGADVTVISEREHQKMNNVKLSESTKNLHGPGNSKLCVLGKLESRDKISVEEIFVVKGLSQALLGRPAIQALGIIEKVNISIVHDKSPNATSANDDAKYREKFSKLFTGLGKTDWEYKIKLDSNAQPYSLSVPRRVPIPLMTKVKNELERMKKLGVISKVDEPTEWCAGMVVVPKPNGEIRICVDLTKLNDSVKCENHPLPSVEESLGQLSGARVFSKLDANSGFWQIKLAPESRPLTTFITPFGRFSFNRLPFGISSASEFFQKRMSEMLQGHMDDILIYAPTLKEHDKRLEKVLKLLEKAGITLNKKCEFAKPRVKFLGQIIDADGCRVDPEKAEAIVKMNTPENVSDVRRLLGMINQLSKFSPNLANKTEPLRALLKKDRAWLWGPAQEKCLAEIKHELTSSPTLAHYDPNKETILSADASSFGLGAVLRQKHGTVLKPVAYASRSMTETEKRYAQIEKEALAITWACEKFHCYLIGTKFEVETDHKPLVPLLGTKDLSELPPRIQRFKMRLMRFQFSISHVAGKSFCTADTLSRSPVNKPSEHEIELQEEVMAFVDQVIESFPASKGRLEQIHSEYTNDKVCRKLLTYCKLGWPEKSVLEETMKPHWTHRGEFTLHNELLLKGNRLVIPENLQKEMLDKIHDGHQGIVKCRERAKSSIWWMGLSKQLEQVVKSCQKCIEITNDQVEPLIPTKFPTRPWQRLATDLFDLNGQTYLLVVDYYSRYIEIATLYGTAPNTVINHLRSIFARHGIPEVLVSDNGPQYSSVKFKQFAREYGFHHTTSSPRYPQSNGMAERAVQTVKKMLKKASDPYIALLTYRSTPLHNGFSPAELLMSRKLQTRVPVAPKTLKPKLANERKLRHFENAGKQKQKYYFDQGHIIHVYIRPCFDKRHRARERRDYDPNDRVWAKDSKTTGQVKRKSGNPRSYITATRDGDLRRNKRNLQYIPPKPVVQEYPDVSETIPPQECVRVPESNPVIGLDEERGYGKTHTKSGRISKPPQKLTL